MSSSSLPPDATPDDELDLDVIHALESNSSCFLCDVKDHRILACPQLECIKGNDLAMRVCVAAILPVRDFRSNDRPCSDAHPRKDARPSNKRSGVSVSSGDGKRLRTPSDNDSIAGFDDIPAECNVHILQFLDVDDLASVAQVSRRFNEDSLHPSLPQNRTATLTCVRRFDKSAGTFSASTLPLLQKLRAKALSDQYWRFNKVKIIGHNVLDNVSNYELVHMVPGRLKLQQVRILDLSFPSNALKKDTKFRVCIPAALTFFMPRLQEIDLSNARVAKSALRNFAYVCLALEKITWNHHQANTTISGEDLDACRGLKELYMDDSVFSIGMNEMHLVVQRDDCIFFRCNTFLERVSLKNAKCRFIIQPHSFSTVEFPQIGLVNFVRKTPSLRWFRSDLSPENVAILKAERPEVTFA
jgi:hypothetical protein